MRRTIEKIKERKGITLIALVVTIVVLLILAGVSISLVLDNNGIIGKSKESRLETRASQVEDEIGLWKQNNFIKSETGESIENANAVLQSLLARKLLNEEEIDREQEIITIKKNDGSILKQISYSQVTINISKQPETTKSGAVLLTIDSVEGMTIPTITSKDELNEYVDSLSETQKKEIIKIGYVKTVNLHDPTANCETFADVLEWVKNTQGQEMTEADFWKMVDVNAGGINGELQQILEEAFGNKKTKRIEGYTVINPDEETSNTYVATENGTYAFKVKDIITGKTYTKKVEVTNIDKSLPTNVITTEIQRGWTYIYLLNTLTQEYIPFEKAYIILNGEKIEIDESDMDDMDKYYTKICSEIDNTLYYLVEEGKLAERPKLYGTTQTFIIAKDGIEYTADVLITRGIDS